MAKELLFDLTNNSTSDPILAQGVYGSALDSTKSLMDFTSIINAKDKVKIGLHELGNILQTASCSPADQGAGTLDEKEVTLCAFDIYFTVCQRTLEQSFLSSRLKPGNNVADFLPTDFKDYLGQRISEKIAEDIEVVTWQGDVVTTGTSYPVNLCAGLGYKMVADSDVIDVALSAITSSNVIFALNEVYNQIPAAVLSKSDVVIYAATNVVRAYRQALANASAEAFYNQKDLTLSFLDVEMKEAPGLASSEMVATYKSNLFYMTDLVNDISDLLVIPQLDKTGKHQIVVSGGFKFGVDYAVGTDIVYYN
jgi:hypothetical protein